MIFFTHPFGFDLLYQISLAQEKVQLLLNVISVWYKNCRSLGNYMSIKSIKSESCLHCKSKIKHRKHILPK